MNDNELVKAVCPKCGKTSDEMPFHTCVANPPYHSAEDRELAEAIKLLTYERNQMPDLHYLKGHLSVLLEAATARRADREELGRLKARIIKLEPENESLNQRLIMMTNTATEQLMRMNDADLKAIGDNNYIARIESQLTLATTALELCERALTFMSKFATSELSDKALAAIKEVKDKS